jgi:H+-transporting ATPase
MDDVAAQPLSLSGQSASEAMRLLGTTLDQGLGTAEVQSRLGRYGHNEVPEQRSSLLRTFLSKFWGLTAWMLEFIILLSWLLGKFSDVYLVSLLLIINAVISFSQETRASGAVEALKAKLHINARVLREGSWSTVPARELVPGDVIRVRQGDFVAADGKLITGELSVDESSLTGESLDVQKTADAVLYSGSIVRRGEGSVVIVATGAHTYFGRTTELVQMARPRLHVEEVVSQVVKSLLVVVGALLSLALVVIVLKRMPVLEVLPLLLVLLLGAIPVALPVMFTVSMAVGSTELAKKNVLVTRLSASEDAATMNVLCVDKTGTITMNRLSVASVQPMDGHSERETILYGALASNEANQDPLDLAFVNAARQNGWLEPSIVQKSFVPFDVRTRRTEAAVEQAGREFRVMKGSVRAVAKAAGLNAQGLARLEGQASKWAQRGYRTLAVAKADAPGRWQLVGLVSLVDAPRPDSRQLLQELRDLGVEVKMLTGDALPIAREIASSVGLGEEVISAAQLRAAAEQSRARAAELALHSDGFAGVYPEDKYDVVKDLQAAGRVVGMTGDGVNDAPALRQAEVGIAVSNATDVAKGAASVVLTSEGLASIVDLVKNGRRIHQRILIWVTNKISRTILKASFVVIAFLVSGKFVVSAFAMLLVTFLNDSVKISLSTDNVRWSQQPATWDLKEAVKAAVALGLLMTVEALGLLYFGSQRFGLAVSDGSLHTFSFEILLYFAIFSILVVRESGHFWNSRPSRTMIIALVLDALAGAVIPSVGIPGLTPLPLGPTLLVIGYTGVFSLGLNDYVKVLLARSEGSV